MTGHADDWLLNAVGGRVREFYAEVGVELPGASTAEASIKCFTNAHGHSHDDRNPSCSINLMTGLWKCHGCDQAGNPYQAAVALGYSEQRARELAKSFGLFLEPVREKDSPTRRPSLPTEPQLRKFRERMMASPLILARLQELKGWTPRAIVRCGLGWDGERIVFTIRDRNLKKVGVVRYLPGGKPKTKALPGSKRLLFPPPEVFARGRPVFLVEGEPDAVSVRSCGCQAVAVPGVSSWRMEFAQRLARFSVVVLPDCDRQGRDLAERVVGMLPRARVVDLEPGREDGYDVGDVVAEASREGGLGQMRRLLEAVAA